MVILGRKSLCIVILKKWELPASSLMVKCVHWLHRILLQEICLFFHTYLFNCLLNHYRLMSIYSILILYSNTVYFFALIVSALGAHLIDSCVLFACPIHWVCSFPYHCWLSHLLAIQDIPGSLFILTSSVLESAIYWRIPGSLY